MATTIAMYYADELVDWSNSINFYDEESGELEKKLGDVIRRNGIIDIAGKVEAKQKLLDEVSDKFYRLKIRFQEQELALRTDHTYIDNAKLSIEMERRQNELRHKMQDLEKEYIDVKFDCYQFLSDVVKK